MSIKKTGVKIEAIDKLVAVSSLLKALGVDAEKMTFDEGFTLALNFQQIIDLVIKGTNDVRVTTYKQTEIERKEVMDMCLRNR